MATIIDLTAVRQQRTAEATRRPAVGESWNPVDPFGLVAASRALVASFQLAEERARALAETSGRIKETADGIAAVGARLRDVCSKTRFG